ncbi:hypothetical protein EW146_g6219 [Bondarzewia mesenterica]|uniref:Glucose-methanol-choline oxidoreductase N-terminal domain-containing protein n=1 Tax=Bondarzewia mesenterica TaxID=1095465 RepID=A0A4S4LRA7_9AGAM|nr:hypothetical protein EW146_g6219 [Bondarzewia mesenterica]
MSTSIDQVSGKTFDYIVVGGGTSGLVLAVRLSEDPTVSVLVLEAGAANLDDPAILTPAAFGSHFGKPEYDWAFNTVAQDNCRGTSFHWTRGKGLGGSSAINFFFQFHRPAKSDIDAFEELGNRGWNWDLLKKYYMKWPLTVAYPITLSNFEKPYHEALQKLGINRAKEPFSGDTKGTWLTPVSIDPLERVRSYSANKYYQPNASRVNLTVLASAQVTKIILNKNADGTVTSTGVSFVHDGRMYQTSVAKEVIVSAGAIMSPQILELSGIGDKDVLQKVGIDVVVDLPGVGANVQEHVYAGASYEVRQDTEDEYLTFDCLRNPAELARQRELYKEGKGVFGMSVICMTFVPLSSISPDSKSIQMALAASMQAGFASKKYPPALMKQYKVQLGHIHDQEPSCEIVLSPRFTSRPKLPEANKKYITIACLINHPFSRGTVHVSSIDPLAHPVIDPRYFDEQYDILSFVELIKFSRRLVQQEPLKSILTGTEVNPGPEVQTDEQIAEDYLKANCTTTYHTVGSCSMLPLQDLGVVDNKLKVYHTTNIRVVDLSIIPLHVGAHLQATAYALGELGADIIKGKVLSEA